MMCSAKELQLVMMPGCLFCLENLKSAKITDIVSKSTTLELEITANRGDCLSHLGVAREVSATTRLPFVSLQSFSHSPILQMTVHFLLEVQSSQCPYYTVVNQGSKIAPSGVSRKDRIDWLTPHQ